METQALAGERASGPLEEVRALRGLIERSAAAHEHASELGAELLRAIEDSNLLRLMAPREVGGLEADPQLLIDVLRELAYCDGSTGWYCGAVMTAGAVAGAFLGDRAVEAIFGGGGKARAAGQAAPQGKAERVGDGYRVSGSFSFGSGSPSADWLVGGYILHEDGAPVIGEHGQPQMLIALVPRAKVEFLGNWDVIGLRGTGSYDFRVLEQIVHEDFVFDPATPRPRRGGALYKMGFMAIPCLTHAAFAVGCGRRALDEWTAFAQAKKRLPRGYANELHTVQRDLALAHGELRAAEAYVRSTFAELYDGAERGVIAEDLRLDGRLCASHATRVAAAAAQAAFSSATTTALREGSQLQRCYRDLQAGAAHFMTGEQSTIDLGAVLADAPGAALIF
ncbi:acyl-CoA dehydrogenase family protein [Phenylobacterium sp. LjRoot219]|uniref:acyl-CoA dehydrogenase family protein n=1 Tax=Phenylobacterium sp. LjRoot219 TaxID=3342283 RepID=UPI003ECC415E